MKPTNFAPLSDRSPATLPEVQLPSRRSIPAIVRSAELTPDTVVTRKNQLEDYVARIRLHAVHQADPALPPSSVVTPVPAPTFTTTINDQPDHLRFVNQAVGFSDEPVTRVDAGHRVSEAQSAAGATAFPPHTPAAHFPIDTEITTARFLKTQEQTAARADVDPALQQHLINEISQAIASTGTTTPSEVDHPVSQATAANTSASDLPVDVAAWDVEDFRWPVLSNQMIATASESVEELYGQVRSVSGTTASHPSTRLAVAGAGRGQGTSTIAISIARWAAACGSKVLLVDADLTSPSLTTSVGLQHGLSWVNAMTRNDSPAEVIIRSQHSNLCVMPLAPLQSLAGVPRFAYDSLGPFLGRVEAHFDWVILDFGPGEQMLAELSRPELLVDSALLVSSQPNKADVHSLKHRLQALGLNRFVLAQNSVQQAEAA